ncbi:HAD-IIIC family phosphatase [Mucilaginibacter sp. KACC 22773]|uniref:HAD-IIIC family phosphatase n=1 Tax=Mucilaginibacter sp. KACC 22773 TaxID=3025671 RepID=UPI0023654471|nr:HAD-IIIC family phosphatase [Mucilaginibacter sp. KACC 22773]WDF79726.1 HAD-IIIC family phosphatase [Mucilaginibacter sp. KACC 22773]
MKVFSELKKNLKNNISTLPPIKVALLGDTATQFLLTALRGTGFDQGFDLQMWEADFNQVERQVFDPTSELYQFAPQVIIIFQSAHKLLGKYGKLNTQQYHCLAEDQMALIDKLHSAINNNSKARIIYYNYTEIDDAIFGSYANKLEQSFLFQLRKLNYELMIYAAENVNFYLCDMSAIQNQVGKPAMFQTSVYINTEMVLSIDVLPLVAARTVDLIGAIWGKFKKCLIVDLDNTMWGGVIGDDGLENIQVGNIGIGKAFTEFQYWIKKLKNRGIIIAVCSKNTQETAMEPFAKHPDMVLHLDDIAVFMANWDNKADNIRKIQAVLNIGFDTMVFLDDNPFERAMVRDNIPGITVPELPEDPADYLEYLYALNLFETASYSNEDIERTKKYQVEAKRTVAQAGYTNEADFLQSLDMVSIVEPFNKFNTPRVSQLSQRSNQFNLRTVRYTDADIAAMIGHESIFSFSFTLADKFGDNGLIAVIILKKESNDVLFIDTWLMSCRVLKRGMEIFILNTIIVFARQNDYTWLKGEYLPTPKNAMVKDHYHNLGFVPEGSQWMVNAKEYTPQNCFIQKK